MAFVNHHDFDRFAYFAGIILLTVTSLAGCRQRQPLSDSSRVVVQPGRGIPNVCEIGMTFEQIKSKSLDASTHGIDDNSWSTKLIDPWRSGRFALVPSIGAIAYLGTNEPISNIDFYVQSSKGKTIPSLEVHSPFRGRIDERLSFRKGPVKKSEIEAAFGRPLRGSTNAAEALDFVKRGEPFWRKRGENLEELWYPPDGIAFVLEKDVVTSFRIYRKWKNW